MKNETHCETNIECDVIDNGGDQDNIITCRGGFNITIRNLTCDHNVHPTTETIPVTSATGCPIGYLQRSTSECVDEDECDQQNKCEHRCANTEGSCFCMCREGYELASSQYNCSDVNECQEWNGGCEYGCENTIGSYHCYCENGHSLKNGTHCKEGIECELIEVGYITTQESNYICKGDYNLTISGLSCPIVNPQQTTQPNLTTNQTDSSMIIVLVAPIGIALFINLVLFIVIITLLIYIKRNNKKKHSDKLKDRKLPIRPNESLYDFIDETVIQNKLADPSDALPISKQPKLSNNQSEHGYLNYPGKVNDLHAYQNSFEDVREDDLHDYENNPDKVKDNFKYVNMN